MKKPTPAVLATLVLAALAAGYAVHHRVTDQKSQGASPAASVPVSAPPPDTTSTDGAAVFRKAFWRQPGEGDRILHAERREWMDEENVSRWQWFIAVEPSPALVKYLREENAFGLTPDTAGGGAGAETGAGYPQAPAWFPTGIAGFDLLRGPDGTLRLLFSKTANQLYATDSGHGFRPGAAHPAAPRRDSDSRHRLPTPPSSNPPPQ